MQDKTQKEINRELSAPEVISRLKTEQPGLIPGCTIVGAWVWLKTDGKPAKEIRQFLVNLGFRWNNKRIVWQHCCGIFCKKAPYDPRDKYKSYPVTLEEN